MKRLSRAHKRLAVQIARSYFANAQSREEFEALVREDQRTKAIDPMLILLLVRVALAIWDYWKSRNTTELADEDDEQVLLGAVRFYKG